MAGLSNIFGGDDQASGSDGSVSTGSVADAGNAVGLDFDSEQNQSSTDEDGATQSSSNSNSLGFDSDTDGLLHSVTDAAGTSDESSN